MIPLKNRHPIAVSCAAATLFVFSFQPLSAQERVSDSAPSPVSAPAASPAARSLASEIVALGYPEEDREQLFFATMDQTVIQMRTAIAPSLPSNDPGAVAILDDWIEEYTEESKGVLRKHIPDIMDGMIEAYATIFTLEELGDILAFVRTRSGRRYFELSPAITGSKGFAEANQRYLDESMAMVGPAQDVLMQRLNEYMSDKRAKDAPPDT